MDLRLRVLRTPVPEFGFGCPRDEPHTEFDAHEERIADVLNNRYLVVASEVRSLFANFYSDGRWTSDVQVIEVERSVEDQGIAALSLAAPHRVDREEQNMSLPVRHINERRSVSQRCAAAKHSAYQQVLFVGEA